MRKILIAATVALTALMTVPAQAALDQQPWRLVSTSIAQTGFLSFTKACHWKKTGYENGQYISLLTTTYTGIFSGCPAPAFDV